MVFEQSVVGSSLLRLRLRKLDSHRQSVLSSSAVPRPQSLLRAAGPAKTPGPLSPGSSGSSASSPIETRALASPERLAAPSVSPRSPASPPSPSSSSPSKRGIGASRKEGAKGMAAPGVTVHIPAKDRLRNKINRQLKEAETVEELLAIYHQYGDQYEHQNVANALHRFAKLYRGSKGTRQSLGYFEALGSSMDSDTEESEWVGSFAHFDEEDDQMIDGYEDDVYEGSTMSPYGSDEEDMYPSASSGGEEWEEAEPRLATDREMLTDLLSRALQLVPQMQPIDYAQVAWAAGVLGLRDQIPLLQAISRRAISECTRLKSQDVANLLLTCGRVQYRNVNLMNALADVSSGRLSRFKPQEISNLLWGYAKCNVSPGMLLLSRAADELIDRIGSFKTKELVMILWSFAVLQYKHDALLTAFAVELVKPERTQSLSPQCVANTLWAYSRFRSRPSDPLTVALKQRAHDLLPRFKALEFGQLMYAMAQLDEVDPALYNAVASVAGRRIQEFRQQELVLLVWSVGKVKYQHEELASTVAEEARRRLESDASPFKPQAIANLLKSFVRLGYRPETLLPHVSLFARRSIRSFRPSEMSNFMYACSKLKLHDPRMVSQVVSEVAMRRRDGKFPDSYLRSIISSVEGLGYVPRALYELLDLPRGPSN